MIKSHPLLLLVLSFIIMIVMNDDVIVAKEISSEPTQQAKELSMVAERLYRNVVDGNLTEVRLETEKIEQIFTSSSFQNITGIEGIHALSECIIEMKIATAQATIQPDLWLTAAAKLRLAADSLNNTEQPLWHQYYKVVREDLSKMHNQLNENNNVGLKKAYDNLQAHYELIRPAVVIHKKPYEVNMIDSWISFAGGITTSLSSKPESIRSAIAQGEQLFNELFGKKRDEAAFSVQYDPYSYHKSIWIAAIFILSILIYVGYKKYQGEKRTWKSFLP
ncbi:hypothetical protein LPB68_03305 [Paenibacillus crassostreae]|nr:hypothetical protein LPB68_03305 [Paenibacillus crassostreae]